MRRAVLVFGSVALTAVLLGSGCRGPAPPPEPVDAAAARWTGLPDDVIAVLYLDVASLSRSELYRALDERWGERVAEAEPGYAELMEHAGFDPRTDLESITVGVGGDARSDEGPVYMIVTGTFDRERIELYARDHGEVETGAHEGLTTYRLGGRDGAGRPPSVVACLDERTLILAAEPDFPRLASAVRGDGRTARSSELAKLLALAGGPAYLALRVPERPDAAASPGAAPPATGLRGLVASQLDGPFAALRTLLLTLDTGQGLDLVVRAEADSEHSGRKVHDTLDGYVALGRLIAAERPRLAELIERLRLERTGTVVSLRLSMTTDEVVAALEPAAGAGERTGS